MVLQEAFICIQNLNMGYSDAMMMPVYERRFFIDLLIKQKEKTIENAENQSSNKNAKGSRQSKISGDALKTRMKNGDIPLN